MGLAAVVYRRAESLLQTLDSTKFEIDSNTGEVYPLEPGACGPLPAHFVAEKRFLGNVATIGALSELLDSHPERPALICDRILYSGSHCGDLISVAYLGELENEIQDASRLISIDDSGLLGCFLADLSALVAAAAKEENPIVFV